MAIFPSDDLSLSSTTRRRLRPMEKAYPFSPLENVKRPAPTNGSSQARDVWGRKKWSAPGLQFDVPYVEGDLLMAFWEIYGSAGFTAFDFAKRTVGTGSYRSTVSIGTTNGGANQIFTIPAKEISSVTVFVDGVQISSGSLIINTGSAPLYDGGGSQGEATVQIVPAQTTLKPVTAGYYGRQRFTCEIPSPPVLTVKDSARVLVQLTLMEKF